MKPLRPQRGVTLIETLVVTFIFTIVSSVLFSMFAASARNFSYGTKTVGLQTDLTATVNIFLDDLSLAGFAGYTKAAYNLNNTNPATNADGTTDLAAIAPAAALASVTLNGGANGNPPDSIQFLADISSGTVSPDGYTDRITYQVTSGSLTRTIDLGDPSGGFTGGTTTDTLAANVTGLQLRLFDKTHTQILTAANFPNTCYIDVTLYTSDPTVKSGIPLSKSLTGETALRNFLSLSTCTN